jgi:hypothetical protein
MDVAKVDLNRNGSNVALGVSLASTATIPNLNALSFFEVYEDGFLQTIDSVSKVNSTTYDVHYTTNMPQSSPVSQLVKALPYGSATLENIGGPADCILEPAYMLLIH